MGLSPSTFSCHLEACALAAGSTLLGAREHVYCNRSTYVERKGSETYSSRLGTGQASPVKGLGGSAGAAGRVRGSSTSSWGRGQGPEGATGHDQHPRVLQPGCYWSLVIGRKEHAAVASVTQTKGVALRKASGLDHKADSSQATT